MIVAAKQILSDDLDSFRMNVKQITVYGDRLEFMLQSGRVRTVTRHYDLSRSENPFTNKVFCSCGAKCERDNSTKGTGLKIWKCPACKLMAKQPEIIRASEELFGKGYGGQIVEYVQRIIMTDRKFVFEMKGGTSKEWQRK